jgi:hypothetical protein
MVYESEERAKQLCTLPEASLHFVLYASAYQGTLASTDRTLWFVLRTFENYEHSFARLGYMWGPNLEGYLHDLQPSYQQLISVQTTQSLLFEGKILKPSLLLRSISEFPINLPYNHSENNLDVLSKFILVNVEFEICS